VNWDAGAEFRERFEPFELFYGKHALHYWQVYTAVRFDSPLACAFRVSGFGFCTLRSGFRVLRFAFRVPGPAPPRGPDASSSKFTHVYDPLD
jgi:hypothetical protein